MVIIKCGLGQKRCFLVLFFIITKRFRDLNKWKRARQKVGLAVRVHDLKHTFGGRLRAAGVSFEDRQDLLGHKSGRITTHYSAAEIGNLVAAADKICEIRQDANSSTLTLLRCAGTELMPARVSVGHNYANANLH